MRKNLIIAAITAAIIFGIRTLTGFAQATPTPVPLIAFSATGHATTVANVRSAPSTTGEIVGQLQAGEAVVIMGVNAQGDWYLLDSGAWVFAQLVAATEATPTRVQTKKIILVPTATPTTAVTVTTIADPATAIPTSASTLSQTEEGIVNLSLFYFKNTLVFYELAGSPDRSNSEWLGEMVDAVGSIGGAGQVYIGFISSNTEAQSLIRTAGEKIKLFVQDETRYLTTGNSAYAQRALSALEEANETLIQGLELLDLGDELRARLQEEVGQTQSAVQAHAANVANLRGGPGTNYAIVGSAQSGQALEIVAKNDAGDWYQLADNSWIAAFLVDNAAADLPVAQDIPSAPTVAPTTAPVVASTQQEQAAPAETSSSIVGIGQELQGNGWRFKVIEVHKRKAVYFYSRSYVAMGNFLIVIVDAVNEQSGTDYFYRRVQPQLTDDAGNWHEWNSAATGYAAWQYNGISTIGTYVNPGNLVRIVMVFDLPDSIGHVMLSTDLPAWVDLGNFSEMKVEDQ